MQKFFSRCVIIGLGCTITMVHPRSTMSENNDSFSENETAIKVSSRLPREKSIDITPGGWLTEDDEVRERKRDCDFWEPASE